MNDQSTQGFFFYVSRTIFYVVASYVLFQVLTIYKEYQPVYTTTVGFMEACRFHHGEIELKPDIVICHYPKDTPKLYKKQ